MNQSTFFDEENQADLERKRKAAKAVAPKTAAGKLDAKIRAQELNRILLIEWFLEKGSRVSYEPKMTKSDESQIWIRSSNPVAQQVDIKKRTYDFTGEADWPGRQVGVCQASRWEFGRPRPVAFVCFNRDRDQIAVVQADTRTSWERREGYYYAPKDVVQWLPFSIAADLEEAVARYKEALNSGKKTINRNPVSSLDYGNG